MKKIMKCLSVIQPYAQLIVTGEKTIELRTWNTNVREHFLVHASKKIDKDACERNKIDPHDVIRGAIIGQAYLSNVKRYPIKSTGSSFAQDSNKHRAGVEYSDYIYGFLLEDAKKCRRPFFKDGRLRFYNEEYPENCF